MKCDCGKEISTEESHALIKACGRGGRGGPQWKISCGHHFIDRRVKKLCEVLEAVSTMGNGDIEAQEIRDRARAALNELGDK